MRILHTSDWHIGKRIGRFDRMEEHRAAMECVVELADAEGADLVLHSGDLFDRPSPPVEALRSALSALIRLSDSGARPVVVVAGNHDSPDLFEALSPLLRPFGVHLVGAIRRPEDGGVLHLDTGAGVAHVACFPFLRAAQVVDFMERADEWYGSYRDRVQKLCRRYAEAVTGSREGVGLLVAHFMVGGVRVHREAPRGERELHVGEAYAADPQAIPPGLDYVALGHIHAPQPVPGARVPAEYAGSLLELDFGEAGEQKRVVLVEAEPGIPARVRSVQIRVGRRLVRAAGTWSELESRDDLDDAYLDLLVDTGGPEPGLGEAAQERFPHLVKIHARYERPEWTERPAADRPLADVYVDYCEAVYGEGPDDALLAEFRSLEDEVLGAAD